MEISPLKVKPQVLKRKSEEFKKNANQVNSITNQMFGQIDQLNRGVWSGLAAATYTRQFCKLENDTRELYRMIREYSDMLIQIANEYIQAEKKNKEKANSLLGSIISGIAVEKSGQNNLNNAENGEEANSYSDTALEFIKKKEGLRLTAYNSGQTIGYGFDINAHPNIKINYNEDGVSITEEEADRLFEITIDEYKQELNNFLEDNSLKIDQNSYDALIDLFYNRGNCTLTREIAFAMAEKDDERVENLLENLDYDYAYNNIYKNEEEPVRSNKAQAYVERNPGLKTRREEEYAIYKTGINSVIE